MSQQMGDTLTRHAKSPLRTGRAQSGNLTTGQRQPVTCQVEFGVAEEVTIQIDNQAPGAKVTAFATATVDFTIDGTPISRTFDVAAGASISGVAQAIRVSVQDSTPVAHPQGVQYGITISIAVQPRPTTAVSPILTGLQSETLAPNAATATIPVPNGANSVVVYGQVWPGYPSFQLAMLTADGVTTILSTVVTPGQAVPLVAGVGLVQVTNMASALSAQVSVIFPIDG